MLVACPDSFAVRAFLNDVARYRRQPLLNGEHPHQEARRRVRAGQFEAEPQPCGAQAEASVVTSNAITGALMAWMLQEMVDSRLRRGVWEYDGRARDTRVGVHSVRPPCDCHLAA